MDRGASKRVVVVGAGPTGLAVGAGLARRGHQVTVLDRDAGPPGRGPWQRRGVMQFGHAHGFRPQVGDLLQREWPAAYDTWLALGAEPREPGPGGVPIGTASRRVTFERALRRASETTPRLGVRQGRVQGLLLEGSQVVGCRVDRTVLDADLVVDASGRSGRLETARRSREPDVLGADCGIAYVNRTYRLRPGAIEGPRNSPIGWFGSFDGYLVLLFPHEAGHFSVVVVRPTSNAVLKELRRQAVFDALCSAVPVLADWTHPRRSTPTGAVQAGGALRNAYRRQRELTGLVAIGDAVATTTPTAGRGIAMAYLQVGELLGLLDTGADVITVAGPFGAWCDEHMLPWVEDHVRNDAAAVRRWRGGDVDLDQPLASDLVVAAADADRSLRPLIGPYLGMVAPPASLAAAEPAARAVFRSGWRPPVAEGPSVAELEALILRSA